MKESPDLRGYYDKFTVTRIDGTPQDPAARYFVLRLDDDESARQAASCYADHVDAKNPILAEDLRRLVERLGGVA